MANEIQVSYTTGQTGMYAIMFDEIGNIWNNGSWVTYNVSNIASYQTFLTEKGTGGPPLSSLYIGDVVDDSNNLSSGKYTISIFLEGADPSSADDDIFIGSDNLYWNGDNHVEIQQTEYDLSQIGLDDTVVSGIADNLKEGLAQLWRRFFVKVTKNSSTNEIQTWDDAGTDPITKQTYAEGATDTVETAEND